MPSSGIVPPQTGSGILRTGRVWPLLGEGPHTLDLYIHDLAAFHRNRFAHCGDVFGTFIEQTGFAATPEARHVPRDPFWEVAVQPS